MSNTLRRVELPPIVFGATSLGNLFRSTPESEKRQIVQAWTASPFHPCVIDSAGKYGAGLSLEQIGKHLQAQAVPPERVLISNKLGWRRIPLSGPEPTFEPGVWKDLTHDAVQDISYDGIMRCWREGNELLGGYSAQLLSVHDPDEYLAAASDVSDRERRFSDIVGAYAALSELKRDGHTLATGVGSKTWQVVQELSEHCEFDWVMLANSFTIRSHPAELRTFLDTLLQRGTAVINSAVFHGGFLLGGDFLDYQAIDPGNPIHAQAIDWRTKFLSVCNQYGVSPFDAGVAFGKSHPAITSLALSSSRADRIQSHIDAAETSLPGEFWQALSAEALIAADYRHLEP